MDINIRDSGSVLLNQPRQINQFVVNHVCKIALTNAHHLDKIIYPAFKILMGGGGG